jgi:hypothetical protein
MTTRKQGRPARTDNPVRLVVHVPRKLKDKLRLQALSKERDMGELVTEALERYLPRVVKVTAGSDNQKGGRR